MISTGNEWTLLIEPNVERVTPVHEFETEVANDLYKCSKLLLSRQISEDAGVGVHRRLIFSNELL